MLPGQQEGSLQAETACVYRGQVAGVARTCTAGCNIHSAAGCTLTNQVHLGSTDGNEDHSKIQIKC